MDKSIKKEFPTKSRAYPGYRVVSDSFSTPNFFQHSRSRRRPDGGRYTVGHDDEIRYHTNLSMLWNVTIDSSDRLQGLKI